MERFVLRIIAVVLCQITVQAYNPNLPAMTSQEAVSRQAVNEVFLRSENHQTLASLVIDSQIHYLPLPLTALLMD